jgi:hypothetical protein
MIEQDRNGEKVLPISARASVDDDLGYEVVLAPADGDQRERLLAKAASGQLARAIFNAAKSEHPDRRIILRRDARVIVDSSSEKTR